MSVGVGSGRFGLKRVHVGAGVRWAECMLSPCAPSEICPHTDIYWVRRLMSQKLKSPKVSIKNTYA